MKNAKVNRSVSNVPDDWYHRILILWEEDDAKPADRETGVEAFERLTGRSIKNSSPVKHYDNDDVIYTLHFGGWVAGVTPEGSFVGVLVEQRDSSNYRVVSKITADDSAEKFTLVDLRTGAAIKIWFLPRWNKEETAKYRRIMEVDLDDMDLLSLLGSSNE